MESKKKREIPNWIIYITIGITLLNLTINISTGDIKELAIFRFESKTIKDYSNGTINADISIRNLIDSSVNFTYHKYMEALAPYLTTQLTTTNMNEHGYSFRNYINYDDYGNKFFLPEYNFNQTIVYGACNPQLTDCVVYSKYKLENNDLSKTCFENVIHRYEHLEGNQKKAIGEFKRYEYFYKNPEKCLNTSSIDSELLNWLLTS